MSRLKQKISHIIELRGYVHVGSSDEVDDEFEDHPQILSGKNNFALGHPHSIPHILVVKPKSVPAIKPRQRVRNPNLSSSKNIMKNYARALANFPLMNIAQTQLREIIAKISPNQAQESVETQLIEFRSYIKENKGKINCIKNLRENLLVTHKDSAQIAGFKRLFKDISIIFLKFFSVNWLFSSKIEDKMTHLKYRMKLLRRVKNPEFFTYLEDSSKK